MAKKKKKKKWDVRKMTTEDWNEFLESESYNTTVTEDEKVNTANLPKLIRTPYIDLKEPTSNEYTNKKEVITPIMKKIQGGNVAEKFAKEFVSNKKTQEKITKSIENDYYKVSSHKPETTINNWVKTDSKAMTLKEKLGQRLGLSGITKGSIFNIKDIKSKVVYQTQEDIPSGSTVKNKDLKKAVIEKPIKLTVIAEDKENYYYRDTQMGEIQTVAKEDVSESKPNLTEHKKQYMEYVVKSNEDIRNFIDKAIDGGVTSVKKLTSPVAKTKIPEQVPLLGGQTVGGLAKGGFEFAKEMAGPGPMGAGGGLMKASEELAEKGVVKGAQLLTKSGGIGAKIAGKTTQGIGGAAAKGAGFIVPYEMLEVTGGEEAHVEDILAGAAFGTIFHVGGKAVSKTLSKIKDNKFLKELKTDMENDVNKLENLKDVEKETALNKLKEKYTTKINDKYKGKIFKTKTEVEMQPSKKVEVPKTEETTISKMKTEEYKAGRVEETEIPPEKETYDITKHVEYKEGKPLTQKLKKLPEKTYTAIFDKYHKIRLFTEKGAKAEGIKNIGKLYTDKNPYKLAQIANNFDVIAKSNIEQGVRNRTGKYVGESLSKIIKQIPKATQEDFQNYVVAKRALDLMEAEVPRKVYPENVSIKQVRAEIAKWENTKPEFKKLQEKIVKYNRNIGKTLLVDTGMLSEKQWKDLVKNHPNYIPLYRSFTEAEAGGKTGNLLKSGFVNVPNQIKKLKGSERKISNVYTNMIENTFNYAKAAKRNEVGQSIYKMLEKNPEALSNFAEIVKKGKDTKFDKSIKQGDLIDFLEEFNTEYDIKEVKNLNKKNIVKVRIDGETKHIQVNDMDFLTAITNLNVDNLNTFLDTMRKGTNIMKILTTANNPFFGILRNVWRDIPTSFIFSKTTSKMPVYNVAKFGVEMAQAAFDMVTKREGFKEYKAQGGGFINSVISGSSKEMMQKSTTRLIKQGFSISDLAKKSVRGTWDVFEYANNILETLPRYREYKTSVKQLMKKGIEETTAKTEGMYRAADVTVNFRRNGGVTKAADTLVPYLNAAVQGLDKFMKEFNPKGKTSLEYTDLTLKALEVVTLPSLFLYFVAGNRDNPDYQKLSGYVKDNYFCIPTETDEFIKIPKSREIGVVFGAIPELLFEKLENDNPKVFNRFLDTLITNFIPPNPITENIGFPIGRNIISKAGSTWRGTPVVNQALLKRPKKLQYDENTSQIAKWIGEQLDFAPKKVDDIMKSYLGGVAQIGIPLTSDRAKISKSTIGTVIEVLKKQAMADPKYSTDIINDFYTNRDKAINDKAERDSNTKNLPEEETYIDRATYVFNKANQYIGDLDKKQKAAKTNTERDKIQKQKINFMMKLIKDYQKNYKNKKFMTSFERQRNFKRK